MPECRTLRRRCRSCSRLAERLRRCPHGSGASQKGSSARSRGRRLLYRIDQLLIDTSALLRSTKADLKSCRRENPTSTTGRKRPSHSSDILNDLNSSSRRRKTSECGIDVIIGAIGRIQRNMKSRQGFREIIPTAILAFWLNPKPVRSNNADI